MRINTFLVIGIITVGAGLRILRHFGILDLPPNFAPISAIALFSAVYFSNKRLALIVPIIAMLASDLFIGFYDVKLMLFVYLSFLISSLIGFWIKRHKSLERVIAGSLLASIQFFLITNFAVWALYPWYPSNLSGLLQSYTLALPFFRNTILGDLFYTGAFFGMYELLLYLIAYAANRQRIARENI